MSINFQHTRVSLDKSKPCTQIYLQKNRKLHKFATCNLEKSRLSDVHPMHKRHLGLI